MVLLLALSLVLHGSVLSRGDSGVTAEAHEVLSGVLSVDAAVPARYTSVLEKLLLARPVAATPHQRRRRSTRRRRRTRRRRTDECDEDICEPGFCDEGVCIKIEEIGVWEGE